MKQIKSLIPYQATISHISKLIIPIFSGMKKVGDKTNEIGDTIPGKTSDPSNLNDVIRKLRRYTIIETKNCDSFGGPKNVFYVSPNLSSDTIFTNQHNAATVECEDFSKDGYRLDTIQYFLCRLGMKTRGNHHFFTICHALSHQNYY